MSDCPKCGSPQDEDYLQWVCRSWIEPVTSEVQRSEACKIIERLKDESGERLGRAIGDKIDAEKTRNKRLTEELEQIREVSLEKISTTEEFILEKEAQIEKMQPVVEAAESWKVDDKLTDQLREAVDAYQGVEK